MTGSESALSNPSTQRAEPESGKFKAILGYLAKPYLKRGNKIRWGAILRGCGTFRKSCLAEGSMSEGVGH